MSQDCKLSNWIFFLHFIYQIYLSFERIVNNIRNFFTPPTYRSSDLTLGGGFEQRLKMYNYLNEKNL